MEPPAFPLTLLRRQIAGGSGKIAQRAERDRAGGGKDYDEDGELMGPMLVAMIAVVFFVFAAVSACVGVVVTVIGSRLALGSADRLLGVYVLGSGMLGAVAAVLFGALQRWNVIGDAIMSQPWIGCPAWGAIGYGWSALAALGVGWSLRWLWGVKGEVK